MTLTDWLLVVLILVTAGGFLKVLQGLDFMAEQLTKRDP